MPLQPAIKLLLSRAEKLEKEIECCRLAPWSTTETAQAQRRAEQYACCAAARLLRDATGDEVPPRSLVE